MTTSRGDEDLDLAQLRALVEKLREENERLREEVRRARRDHHEVPPHYL